MKKYSIVGALLLVSAPSFALTLPSVHGIFQNGNLLPNRPATLEVNINYSIYPDDISDVNGYRFFSVQKKALIGKDGGYELPPIPFDKDATVDNVKVVEISTEIQSAGGATLIASENQLYLKSNRDFLTYQQMLSSAKVVRLPDSKKINLKLPQDQTMNEYLQSVVEREGYPADFYNWKTSFSSNYWIRQESLDQYAHWTFQAQASAVVCYGDKDKNQYDCDRGYLIDKNQSQQTLGNYELLLETPSKTFLNLGNAPLWNHEEVTNLDIEVSAADGTKVADIYIDFTANPGFPEHVLNQMLPLGSYLNTDIQLPGLGSELIRTVKH